MKAKILYLALAVAMVFSFAAVPIVPAGPAVAASNWYVATTGSDTGGDGSEGDPWGNISYAISHATDGDTIIVAPGTYNASLGETFPITVDEANLTISSSAGAATTIIEPVSTDLGAFEVTAAGVTIGGSGFTIGAGVWAGIYGNVTGGDGITVQDCIFKSYRDGESRGMWFEKLWNGALITGNSFATPKVGTGILVQNADGATISNNTVAVDKVKYAFLAFKAEAFNATGPLGPGAEYVAQNPSLIDNVLVTGNSVTDVRWGIRFGASTKPCEHGCPQAQDLTVSSQGVTICDNNFTNNTYDGVKIDADKSMTCIACDPTEKTAHIYGEENIHINFNNFDGNTEGVDNGQDEVDAENNWWGDASGPSGVGPGSGDSVGANVDYDPWLTAPVGVVDSETISGSGTMENTPSGGNVTIVATGNHTLTVVTYTSNPGGATYFTATGNFWDVHLDSTDGVNSVTIEFCPVSSPTQIYYWDGWLWDLCSDQSYSDGCVVVTVTSSTHPSLSDLSGQGFASGGPPFGVPEFPSGLAGIAAAIAALFVVFALRTRALSKKS